MRAKQLFGQWLVVLPLTVLGQGCAGRGADLWRAGMGGGGAVVGYHLGNGSAVGAAAGAVGGLVLSEGVLTAMAKGREQEFLHGYEMGMNDAVKRQYWLIQAQQRLPRSRQEAETQTVYYNFPGPEQFQGVRFVPHTLRVEVQQ